MKQRSCYCIKCGEKNKYKDKICTRCGSKLKQMDMKFLDYLLDRGKSDISGKIEGGIFDAVKTFFKNHLYGTILSITIVASVTANVVVRLEDSNKYVDEKPEFVAVQTGRDTLDSLFSDFLSYYNNGNKEMLDGMLLQTNYPEIANKYDIDVKQDNLYKYFNIFKNTYHTTNDLEKDYDDFINSMESPVIYDLSKKMNEDGYEVYDYYLHTAYFLNGLCGMTDEDEFLVGLFDADLSFIKIDNKYYINYFKLLTKDEPFFEVDGYIENAKDLNERTVC